MDDKKILVVDDSPTVINILRAIFEEKGYSVFTAVTGLEGVKLSGEIRPHVVVVDTVLPDINGFEVCRKIKEKASDKVPSIIIITGNVDAVDAVEAKRSGADDYVVKTSDFELLTEVVEKTFDGLGV